MAVEPDVSLGLINDIGFLLSRAGGQLLASANVALSPLGLKARSYSVLMTAAENEDGVNQRRMAELLALDPSQIVGIVDELEKRHLVERRPDTADRRNKLIFATAEGRALRTRAQREVNRAQKEFFDDVPASTSVQLRKILQTILFPDQR